MIAGGTTTPAFAPKGPPGEGNVRLDSDGGQSRSRPDPLAVGGGLLRGRGLLASGALFHYSDPFLLMGPEKG